MGMLTESGLRKIIKEELKRVIMEDAKQEMSDLLYSLAQDLLNIQSTLQPQSNPREKQIDDSLDRAQDKLTYIINKGGYREKFQSITPQTTRFLR